MVQLSESARSLCLCLLATVVHVNPYNICILSSTPLQFGLKAFYRRHEEVIAEIILQRDLCVKELAAIEESLDIETDRKHFKRRMQMEGKSEDKEHVNSDYWNNTE